MTKPNSKKYLSEKRSSEWSNTLRHIIFEYSKLIVTENNITHKYPTRKYSLSFEQEKESNLFSIKGHFNESQQRIESIIDNLMSLYSQQIAGIFVSDLMSPTQHGEVNFSLISCFDSSVISLYTSYHLTNIGLYDPARLSIRHSFEAVFVAKYISINRGADLFDLWIDGHPITLSSKVLNKIINPNTDIFKDLWKVLNRFSHPTRFWEQKNLDISDKEDEIRFNYQAIESLLECLYHLLNIHIITPKAKYYMESYAKGKKIQEIRNLKTNLRKEFVSAHKSRNKVFAKFFNAYRSKWITK